MRFGIGSLTNRLHGLIEYWECLMRFGIGRLTNRLHGLIENWEWNSLLRSCLKLRRAAILPAGCVLQEPVDSWPIVRCRSKLLMNSFGYLLPMQRLDRKSTRLNSSHLGISYAVFCL